MRNFLKLMIFLSILSYLNVLLLNYQIRTDGIASIHPFWLFTVVLPLILNLFGFSESFKHLKRYTFIDLMLKVTIVLTVLQASNLELTWYLLFNLITIPLFISDIMIEAFMLKDYETLIHSGEAFEPSYLKMLEETQMNPKHSLEIQTNYLNTIRYSRTLIQIIIASIFELFGVISVLSILKYHDLVAGILLSIAAIVSLLISSFNYQRLLSNHVKLKDYISGNRLLINILSIASLMILVAVFAVVYYFLDLELYYYLLLPLLYTLAMPIVISNNYFAHQLSLNTIESIQKK